MRRTVYIETTIPSFYYEVRREPAMVARRESTRRWWREESPKYDLVISAFVLGELGEGSYSGKASALRLVGALPVLEVTAEVEDISAVYMAHGLMPRDDIGDAFHLATASYYSVDFLLTWNCRHLANANKTRHLQVINTRLGLHVPIVTTPDLLVRQEDDNGQG